MKTAIICCLLIIAAQGLLVGKDRKPCTEQDAMRALDGATALKDWSEVYSAFKEFGQCDQGAIAEGYSDSIARLLSEQWSTADQLNRLTLRDRNFEQFVLGHVDELMSPDQADTIRKNAETHCPSDAKRLCKSIAARIRAVPGH